MSEVQVAIVGAGPSGLITAMELGAAGVPAVVLEKRDEPALSRAGVLQPRVLELFAMRGLADEVLSRAAEVNGAKHRTAAGIWAGLPGIDYGLLDSPYPFITVLSQLEVERILARRCLELGVEIRRGCEVTGLAARPDGVRVSYIANGVTSELDAQYVVGADGARSAVRQAAGIGWEGHAARNLAINVDAPVPSPFDDPVVVVNNRRGWGLAYPLSESVTRFAVIEAATMLGVGRELQISREQALTSLRAVFGDDFGITEARISQFHDAMYRASHLRRDRVFLVGESVRVHYPASGVGMNFCIQDAFNLAWKLAATLQGWGSPGLLDSYETERGADVDALLDSVRTQTGMQFSFTDESIALKDFFMNDLIPQRSVQLTIAEQLSGLATRYAGRTDVVGSPVRDEPINGGSASLFSVIRPDGYVLLQPGHDSPQDFGQHVTAVRRADDSTIMVVRPDGYIAATGEDTYSWLEKSLSVPVA